MLSAHCQIPFSSITLVPDNNIQGSLIFGSNAAVSDVLHSFWAATCWSNDNILSTSSSYGIGSISGNSPALFVRSITILIFISANDNWFTFVYAASVVHHYQMYDNGIKSRHVVCAFSQFHLLYPSNINQPPQKWINLHASHIWLTNFEHKANGGYG